ncbi:winged helix-turn-helix domain-containing protein [Pseudomarimonas salicorniae]|uniref:Winged helix-turn-helix domain-containing protein n=1 Tax=Pseudomarimonas salicorniae TaxID=2933270 RepID=A0ABT0GI35_9GAMM|nr:winged helix-turn-helix domain-containing protein [Lysobacter sp. CAU 1642]MCK7594216.1 winged helix-turn-helix domain-containing protein [Lysobacter sp. CAU 1642]
MPSDPPCIVDLESGDVMRDGRIDRLPPRLLSLLRFFVEHAREVISRDQLIESVWGHLEAASDDSVNVAVSDLRRALGDSRRPHRIIETVPRRGYRYRGDGLALADLSQALSAAPPGDPAEQSPAASPAVETPTHTADPESLPSASPRMRWPLVAGLLVVTLGIAMVAWHAVTSRTTQPPPAAAVAPSAKISLDPSIAVLPFLDLSQAGDQRHFADALVDRIIHMLAQVQGLQVAARTSSFAFRDGTATIDEIGEALRVRAVLEGSLMHDGERLRVVAQLIDVESGMHLWSKSYDREEGEFFALQDEIASEVSRTLTDSLLPERALRQPRSRAAYDLTTRARFARDEDTLASAEAAQGFYLQALEHDPDYVPALVGLFEIGGLLVGHRGRIDQAALARGLEALDRARSLAPDDPEVLRALAMNERRLGNREQALSLFERALDGNPNDAGTWVHRGDLLLFLGRFDEALDSIRQAQRIDPLSHRIGRRLADAYWAVGRAEEALAQLKDTLRQHPEVAAAYGAMSSYLIRLGRSAEAMRYLQAQRRLDPDSPIRWMRECEMYLQLGDDFAAETCTDALAAAHDSRLHELYLRQAILGFRGEWEARHALMDELLDLAWRNDRMIPALVADSYARQDCGRALEILEQRMPGLFASPPEVAPSLSMASRVAVRCLRGEGRDAEAESLLAAFAAMTERLRLQQGPELVIGLEQAWVHALQGRDDAALEALTDLVDKGWRYYWWQLDAYPEFAGIVESEDFGRLLDRLEAGVAEQRRRYMQQRDAPLIE